MSMAHAAAHARNRNFPMAAVEATPDNLFVHVYNRLPTQCKLYEDDHGFWILTLENDVIKVPRPKEALRFTHIGSAPQRRVYDKYTDSGAFTPNAGDVVVDVGAYLGEFSRAVSDRHDCDVVAVEPDPRSVLCLRSNLPVDVTVVGKAVGDEATNTILNVADSPSESGILPPDSGRAKPWTVRMDRLDNMVDDVDYLKVEAEGYEPEVLTGMGGLRPGKVVVNVSPERDGESPAEECASILRKKGYDTDRDGDTLFARLP